MVRTVAEVPSTVGAAAFDAATAAVDAALAAGARYADARLVDRRYESMTARDGDVRALTQTTSPGLGVRALAGSSWGFAPLGAPPGRPGPGVPRRGAPPPAPPPPAGPAPAPPRSPRRRPPTPAPRWTSSAS